MSTCTCGRTTRKPMCDGSHTLTEEQYKERTEKLNKLFQKDNIENNKNVKRTV